MANKQKNSGGRDITLAVLFMILAVGVIVFFSATDVFTLFNVTGLTLDATSSRGTPDERGIEASTGQFTGQANFFDPIDRFTGDVNNFLIQQENLRLDFTRPFPLVPPTCRQGACSMMPPALGAPTPPTLPTTPVGREFPTGVTTEPLPTTVTVIDLRTGQTSTEDLIGGAKGGGVASSDDLGLGVQELIRNEVVVHERYHTPANNQPITGSLLLGWGHGQSITVQQFLVPNEYFDWFEFELPQTIRGDGVITFDGLSEGEFVYRLRVPDLIDKDTVIPIRLIINTLDRVVDGVTEIQIERPEVESETFSVAELIRSILTEIRQAFA